MKDFINYLKHVNYLILKENLNQGFEMVGGTDFNEFGKRLSQSIDLILENITKREKGYSDNISKFNKKLKKHLNDMKDLIENREDDKDKSSLFNNIDNAVNVFQSLIFGDGSNADMNQVFNNLNIPGLENLMEDKGNPLNSLISNDENLIGGGNKIYINYNNPKEVSKYLDPNYDNYVNLLDKRNRYYQELKDYIIQGPVKPYKRMVVDMLGVKEEEDGELEKLKEIFNILLLSIYKLDDYPRFRNLSFDHYFLQNEEEFPHGVMDCGLSDDGITLEKALDRMQDTPGYCNKLDLSMFNLKRHYLKQIHRLMYIKKYLIGTFPKLKVMGSWVIGVGGSKTDDPFNAPVELEKLMKNYFDKELDSRLKDFGLNRSQMNNYQDSYNMSPPNQQFMQPNQQNMQSSQQFNDNNNFSGISRGRISEESGPTIENSIDNVQFVNPGAVLINKRLNKMESLQNELYKLLKIKEDAKEEKNTDKPSYLSRDKEMQYFDSEKEKKELIENQNKLEDLFKDFMEENALVMNAQIRMLNDVQSSVGVVSQRRDFEDSKLEKALESLENLNRTLGSTNTFELDDEDEDDEDYE